MTASSTPLIDRGTLLYALDALEDAYALFDAGDRLVFFNRRCHDVLGVPDGHLSLGLRLVEVIRVFACAGVYDRTRRDSNAWDAWRASRLSAAGLPPEFRTVTGRWVRAKEHPLANGATLIAFRDVTAELEAEACIRAVQEAAEDANRAKSEFLANMSHELRTPLNAIIGFAETMAGEILGPLDNARYREYAGDIVLSGKYLLNIINDILDLSKIEAGRLELHLETLELAPVFERCAALVRHRAAAAGVAFSVSHPDSCAIVADQVRFKQILLNLLTNAIKFTPKGGKVELRAAPHADGRLEIRVRDTGIGMQPEDIPRALEPFRQIDSAYNRSREGTGLGLPLVKRLTELHGAVFAIESAPGQGTTVTIVWPCPAEQEPPHA